MTYAERIVQACRWRWNLLTENSKFDFPEWPEDEYKSQIGQDKWVTEVVFPGKRDGFFIDIGAYDGVTISNTYMLEKQLGWRGICIEAGSTFDALRKNRDCMCENVCLAAEPGAVMYSFRDWESGITSLLDKQTRGGVDEKIVEARTLASVLEKYNAPSAIDFCSLDTEGSEYEILRTFPFEKYIFRAMAIEHNNAEGVQSSLRTLLASRGYRLFMQVGIDDWWLHESMVSEVVINPVTFAENYFRLWGKTWEFRHEMVIHDSGHFCLDRSGPRLRSLLRAIACGFRICFRK